MGFLRQLTPLRAAGVSRNGVAQPPLPPCHRSPLTTYAHKNAPTCSSKHVIWLPAKISQFRRNVEMGCVTFALAMAVRLFVLEPRYIPSSSMFPTFTEGDMLLVDKLTKWFKKFMKRDVVVFTPTDMHQKLTGERDALVKRIVATAGDIMSVQNRRLYVNGVIQDESYVADVPEYTMKEITVPEGMVVVLGDNRNHSFDSHDWGFLPIKNIIGRAVLKYWPPSRIGLVGR